MPERIVAAWIHPGTIAGRFMQSMLKAITDEDSGITDWIALTSGPRIAAARNEVVQQFLRYPDAPEWLFMVDADMVFEPDTAVRLMRRAVELKKQDGSALTPIVGALCFGGGRASRQFPTMYQFVDPADNGGDPVRKVVDYPRDAVVKIDGTGAACLVVHRDLLEAMAEKYSTLTEDGVEYPNPLPFFAEVVHHGREIGEDLAFCMRAAWLGASVYVDTTVKVGHEKAFVMDEASFDVEQAQPSDVQRISMVEPVGSTTVVIPVKDEPVMTADLLKQLYGQGGYERIIVLDNGSGPVTADFLARHARQGRITVVHAPDMPFYAMWNRGLSMAREECGGAHQVAFLNNDLRIGPRFLDELAVSLRSDEGLWAVCPTYKPPAEFRRDWIVPPGSGVTFTTSTFKNGGLAGFAFMLKAETPVVFDERFELWWGDDDMVRQIEEAGHKVGITGTAWVEHLNGGSNTVRKIPDATFAARVAHDLELMTAKWGEERL